MSRHSVPGGQVDHVFKLLLIGDSGTGKSSIFMRFTEDIFREDVGTTIGVDFKVRHLFLPQRNTRVKLTLWDTAGQERFRTLTSSYYRGAHGVVLVYDITSRSSFESLEHWCREVETYASYDDVVKILVGNKLDLDDGSGESKRQVSEAEGRQFARRHGMLFLECSALRNENIDKVFEETALKILDTESLVEHSSAAARSGSSGNSNGAAVSLDDEGQFDAEESGWCCL